jgi:predicted dehydrogenase
VGLGDWGPRIARNLNDLNGCELAWCCDSDTAKLDRWRGSFPDSRFTHELDELLADPELDALAIATPVPTHASLTERVLLSRKHCFVEKPLAQDVSTAEALTALAVERGRVLMVGHLLCYHPGIRELATLIAAGELGDVYYLYSQRLNLGKLQADENVLWDLGAHDVSVLLELAEGDPSEVSAYGQAHVRSGVEEVVFAYIRFDSGLTAHMQLSWLDPHKMRKVTVVGSERMATMDDMSPERKLTIWDKGFDPAADGFGEYVTRSGAVWSPALPNQEPLRVECEHFVDSVRTGRKPLTDGDAGVRVVRVLEGLQRSIDAGGAPQPLESDLARGVR